MLSSLEELGSNRLAGMVLFGNGGAAIERILEGMQGSAIHRVVIPLPLLRGRHYVTAE